MSAQSKRKPSHAKDSADAISIYLTHTAGGASYQTHARGAAAPAGVLLVALITFKLTRPRPHRHESEAQCLVVLDGKLSVNRPDARLELTPGQACWLPADTLHDVISHNGSATLLDLRLTPEAAAGVASDGLVTIDRELLQQAIDVVATAANRSAGVIDELETATLVWGQLVPLLARPTVDAEDTDARLRLVERHIRSHLDDDLDVTALARVAGLSRSQLTRLATDTWQVGPAEFVRRVRLDEARRLLRQTAMSVKEVSHACGFASPNHFSRVFTTHFSQPPTAERAS
ncbi:MAG: AraC family transcriptional regulator [Planctomycetota bacterium]